MRYARISDLDKQRLVDAFDRNEDYIQLAQQLNIKRTTAYAIIRRYQETNGQISRPRGGFRGRRLSPEMLDVAISIVEENNALTLNQINEELVRRLPSSPRISISTLCRSLRGSFYRMKKLEIVPVERNTDHVKNERHSFATWLLGDGMNQELIFVDEAGFNLWTSRTRGRALIGEPAIRVVNGRRGRNLSMIFAVSQERGLLSHEIVEGAVNGDK